MSNINTIYSKLVSKRTGKAQYAAISTHPNNEMLVNVVSARQWENGTREVQTNITTLNVLSETYNLIHITRDQWIHEFAITISEMCSAACISDFQINIK